MRSATARVLSGAGALVSDGLVVTNDLGDDEGEELLREDRIQTGIAGKCPQTVHLAPFSSGIGGGKAEPGLEHPHALGAAEALGQQVDERGVEVVYGRLSDWVK